MTNLGDYGLFVFPCAAPEALNLLFSGGNTGKVIVAL